MLIYNNKFYNNINISFIYCLIFSLCLIFEYFYFIGNKIKIMNL